MNQQQLNELDRLILDVSNASHLCGAYRDDEYDGYQKLLNDADESQRKLRDFVILLQMS